jgi:methyl-accepting chemotaxis protein
MTELMNFMADLLSKAEFWSVSTLGVSVTSILALLWAKRGQLALTASNVIQKGLQEEVKSVHQTELLMLSQIEKQKQEIETLVSTVKLLNDNIYVLAQAANIGIENKQLIAKNYLQSNEAVPLVTAAVQVVNTAVKDLTEKAEQIEKKSSLDDLLKKV